MAKTIYFETINGTKANLLPEVAEHLSKRLRLGKAVIICDQPELTQKQFAKFWKRISSTVQNERDLSIDADQKLRLTAHIVRLQSARFGQNTPLNDVIFASTSGIKKLDISVVKTVYVLTRASTALAETIAKLVPGFSLVVAPTDKSWQNPTYSTKQALIDHAESTWKNIVEFLDSHHVDLSKLAFPSDQRVDHMGDALDYLLDDSAASDFINLFNTYRLQTEAASPYRKSSRQLRLEQTVAVLAKQVYTFAPSLLDTPFRSRDDDPSFFLNDRPLAKDLLAVSDTLLQKILSKKLGHLNISNTLAARLAAY